MNTGEEQFRTMANAMPHLAWMANSDGFIFWYNQGWYDYTGTTPQQMEGWGWQSVHDPAKLPSVMERWNASIATGEPFEMIFSLRGARGEFRFFLTRVSPMKDTSGKVVRWFGTNTDVEEQKRAEETNRAQAALLDSAHDAISVRNADDQIVFWNDGAVKTYGWRREEVIGRVTHDLLQTVFPEPLPEIKAKVAVHGAWDGELTHICKSGAKIVVDSRWVAHRDMNGNLTGTLEINRDITERKMAESELQKSKERLELAVEIAEMGEWELDLRTSIASRSLRHDQIFGYQSLLPEWTYEMFLNHVLSEHRAEVDLKFKAALKSGTWDFETRIRRADGEVRWIWARGRCWLDEEGQPSRMFGNVLDITARKQGEQKLRASLEEKTALLQEVHHRVKNNLQIVSSLLNLQARKVKNQAALETLHDTQGRIRSMALLHETLYRDGNAARVNCAVYFGHLCAHLCRAFGHMAERVRVRTDVAPVELEVDLAIPCGLIVNELVSNSFKHAFPHGRRGEIMVRLHTQADGWTFLSVADDGIGFSSDLVYQQTGTLGMQLVTGLAKQVDAAIEVKSDHGTMIQISFLHPDKGGPDL